jgi:hypothetical protein
MLLKGSCHCGAVTFKVKSSYVYPYQYCYCSICRKTQGGAGAAVNISADANTLKVSGKKYIKIYRAKIKNPEDKRAHQSSGERNFCKICSSGLWLFDPEWPDLIHPFASVIDSELPKAPEHTHLMLDFKSQWVQTHALKKDKKFKRYPKESIAEWHTRLGLDK